MAIAIGLLPWVTWAKRGAEVGADEVVWCSLAALLLAVAAQRRVAKVLAHPVGYGLASGLVTGAMALAVNVWFNPDYSQLKCIVTALGFALCLGCWMAWWRRRYERTARARP